MMENRKSYAAQKKSHSLDFSRSEESFVQDVYIQMIIDEALFYYRKDFLEKQIDAALDARDQIQFDELSEQYRQLLAILN